MLNDIDNLWRRILQVNPIDVYIHALILDEVDIDLAT